MFRSCCPRRDDETNNYGLYFQLLFFVSLTNLDLFPINSGNHPPFLRQKGAKSLNNS